MKEIFLALIGKTLSIPAEEAASLLFEKKEDGSEVVKDGALDKLLARDKDRIQKIKDEGKTLFDNGYQKAQKEVLTKFEKEIRDKFNITEDKQGIELIDTVVASKVDASGNPIDEEKVKRSPFYLNMIDKMKKEAADAVAAEQKKLSDLQTSIQRESTLKTVSEQIRGIVGELNPVLPSSKEKADAQIARFIGELGSSFDYEIVDNKVLVKKDGKLYEDAHGHRVELKDIVKQRASELWDFKQGEGRSGSGNSNDGGNGGQNGGYSGPVPKSEEDYLKAINDAPDEKTKIEITKAYTGVK